MKGWKIFVHSVRQVFGNLGAALRISGVLYLVQVGVLYALGLEWVVDPTADVPTLQPDMSSLGKLVTSIAVLIVTNVWIAVNWHRYILTAEEPGLFPGFHGGRMLGYYGKGLLIVLILVVPILVFVLVTGAIAAWVSPSDISSRSPGEFDWFAAAFGSFITLVVGIPFLRFSTMLPGAALQPDVPVGSGWAATKGQWGVFALLSAITAVWSFLLPVATPMLAGSKPLLMIFQAVHGWLLLIIGVSILTTLYGHYIEKRPLL